MIRYSLTFILALISSFSIWAQDMSNSPWHIQAEGIDPNEYYGVTCANGVVGLVSSPEPMQVKDVILNGVYDYYQRGRVSNILKTFNHMNIEMEVDGQVINGKNISNFQQFLDMKTATFHTQFDMGKKVTVSH